MEPFRNVSIGFLTEEDVRPDGTIVISKEMPKVLFLCMVYANWCGPCKLTKPQYAALSRMLDRYNLTSVRLLAINATHAGKKNPTLSPLEQSEKRLAESIDERWTKDGEPMVAGFPTILFIRGGQVIGKHTGAREVDSFLDAIREMLKTEPGNADTIKAIEHYKELSPQTF